MGGDTFFVDAIVCIVFFLSKKLYNKGYATEGHTEVDILILLNEEKKT